jgi:hypothetical protein
MAQVIKRKKKDGKEIHIVVHQGEDAMDINTMKTYLGWVDEAQASEEEGKEVKFGSDYHFRDCLGNKVRITNSLRTEDGEASNRPLALADCKKYAVQMLSGRWNFSCEGYGINEAGRIIDGQHRLVAAVFAEQTRQANLEACINLWEGNKDPFKLEGIVIIGIEDNPDLEDTLNTGRNRKLKDVLYRNYDGWPKGTTDKEVRKYAPHLQTALKVVWERTSGKNISAARHFPHNEAKEFIKKHPKLVNCVIECVKYEDGAAKNITTYVSLPYMAAIMYLGGTSRTDYVEYLEEGAEAIDYTLMEQMETFVSEFTGGVIDLQPLRNVLININARSGAARDEIVGLLVKAVNLYLEGKKIPKTLKLKKTKDEHGALRLAERPRLGGLDIDVNDQIDKKVLNKYKKPNVFRGKTVKKAEKVEKKEGNKGKTARKTAKKATKSKKVAGITRGTDVWVKTDDDEERWEATVQEIHGEGEEVTYSVFCYDDEEEYEVLKSQVEIRTE